MKTYVRPSFKAAKEMYLYRYTMEHVPAWVRIANDDGKFYAPQFSTDLEWYENTRFPGEEGATRSHCFTNGQTWPLGKWLDKPFMRP